MFDDNTVHTVETVRNFWVMAMHTLKGQYDDLKLMRQTIEMQDFHFYHIGSIGLFLTFNLRHQYETSHIQHGCFLLQAHRENSSSMLIYKEWAG